MRKSWMWIACGVAFVGAAMLNAPQDAQARPKYLMGFKTAYPAVKDTTEAATCMMCHYGDSKKNRNDYAKAVGDALGKDAKDIKDDKAIGEALKKAEAAKSSTEGKTFGDLLKDGKVPGKNP